MSTQQFDHTTLADESLLSVWSAGTWFSVPMIALHQAATSGVLPSINPGGADLIGKRFRFRVGDLRAWIAQGMPLDPFDAPLPKKLYLMSGSIRLLVSRDWQYDYEPAELLVLAAQQDSSMHALGEHVYASATGFLDPALPYSFVRLWLTDEIVARLGLDLDLLDFE